MKATDETTAATEGSVRTAIAATPTAAARIMRPMEASHLRQDLGGEQLDVVEVVEIE
jgi:hypothetical protein